MVLLILVGSVENGRFDSMKLVFLKLWLVMICLMLVVELWIVENCELVIVWCR